jgi:hypothetical protein
MPFFLIALLILVDFGILTGLAGHREAHEAASASAARSCCDRQTLSIKVFETFDVLKCILRHLSFLPWWVCGQGRA